MTVNGTPDIYDIETKIRDIRTTNHDSGALKDKLLLAVNALRRRNNGDSINDIADHFGVSRSWIKELTIEYILGELERLKARKTPQPFFVPVRENGKVIYYVDVNDGGREYKKLNVPFKIVDHGLCKPNQPAYKLKEKRIVLRAVEPIISAPIIKPITVGFLDGDKKKSSWTFEANEVREAVKVRYNDELSDREIAIRVCAPREAVIHLFRKLKDKDIEKILGGEENNGRNNTDRGDGEPERSGYDMQY